MRKLKVPLVLLLAFWLPLQTFAMAITTLSCEHELGAGQNAAHAGHATHCDEKDAATKNAGKSVHTCEWCAVCVLSLGVPVQIAALPVQYQASALFFNPTTFFSFIPDQPQRPPLSRG